MKRTPLRNRSRPLKRTGSLAPVSRQQRRRNARYAAARDRVWERDMGVCQRHLRDFDQLVDATECHHKAGRIGPRMWDESLMVMLCSPCHTWATENPAEAFASGWSVRRNGSNPNPPPEVEAS